jgi:hypothetical protein
MAPVWVEITVAVIGSSLIGFLLTNLALEYDQPKIRINVDKTFENMTQKRYDTTIANEGNSGATNLSVTLHYLAGKITNYRIGFAAEKSTPSVDPEHQDTLVINVPRFAPSAVMLISTIVNNTQASFYVDQDNIKYSGDYVRYNGSYFVSAIYDQGGTQSSSSNITQRAYQPIERLVPFSTVVGLFIGIATVLAGSVVIYLWKKPGPSKRILMGLVAAGLIVVLLYFSGIWAPIWS